MDTSHLPSSNPTLHPHQTCTVHCDLDGYLMPPHARNPNPCILPSPPHSLLHHCHPDQRYGGGVILGGGVVSAASGSPARVTPLLLLKVLSCRAVLMLRCESAMEWLVSHVSPNQSPKMFLSAEYRVTRASDEVPVVKKWVLSLP